MFVAWAVPLDYKTSTPGASPSLSLPGRRNRNGSLKCVEIFSGRSAIYLAFVEAGLPAARFDTRVSRSHNIHEKEGVYQIARMISQLDPKEGVCILEPTCSSWTWINRGSSLRNVVPYMKLMGDCFGSLQVDRWGCHKMGCLFYLILSHARIVPE